MAQLQALRPNFWQKYPLDALTTEEWEALCDGCGVCCLIKFLDDDEEQQEVAYTDVACQLLDCQTGWCSRYDNRHEFVPDCIRLTYEDLADMMWLPDTCAYKRLYLGLELPDWHLLITADKQKTQSQMQQAGVSVAGRCVSEIGMSDEEMEERVIHWVAV